MTELVREPVRLRGLATLGADFWSADQAGVQVDRGVARAVEGTDGRAGCRRRGRLPGERDHLVFSIHHRCRPSGTGSSSCRPRTALAVPGDLSALVVHCCRSARHQYCVRLGLHTADATPIRSPGLSAEEQSKDKRGCVRHRHPGRVLPHLQPQKPPICEGSSCALSRYLTIRCAPPRSAPFSAQHSRAIHYTVDARDTASRALAEGACSADPGCVSRAAALGNIRRHSRVVPGS